MPTALELGPEGWQPFIEAAKRRSWPLTIEAVDQQERERILVRVREAALVLKRRFGAQRVVLFGSLAHTAWFMPDSDVDLAVQGVPHKLYWQAWRCVEEIVGDRPVDLIDIESARDSLRQAIERYGMEL